MAELNPIQLCFLGHSGIGKSPLTKLFDKEKVGSWDPFRVRKPRNEEDAKVCKSYDRFNEILKRCSENEKLIYRGQSKNQLLIYETWSFFKVRDKDQCLEHKTAQDAIEAGKSLRIEIYAPVLVEMLEATQKEKVKKHLPLDSDKLLIVLLNPTLCSFEEMKEPDQELCLATLFSITERSRIQGKGVGLADGLRRVEYLKEELEDWKKLLDRHPGYAVECKKWAHFEFRYLITDATLSNAQIELIKARASILKCIEEHASDMFDQVKSIMYTPEEIVELTQIV